MATGTRAFEGHASGVVFDAILNRSVRPLQQVNPAIPRELERIVERCIQKRPEARYQQAREVLTDLRTLKRLRDSAAASRGSGAVAKAPPSIAVLPFADMSPQKDQDAGFDQRGRQPSVRLPPARSSIRRPPAPNRHHGRGAGGVGSAIAVTTV